MNKILNVIKSTETEILKFKPGETWYKKIGINKKRFWLLVRGDKPATIDELRIIAVAFKVPLNSLIQD
jgi:hypothetical protein